MYKARVRDLNMFYNAYKCTSKSSISMGKSEFSWERDILGDAFNVNFPIRNKILTTRLSVVTSTACALAYFRLYTVFQKLHPSIFCNNFVSGE